MAEWIKKVTLMTSLSSICRYHNIHYSIPLILLSCLGFVKIKIAHIYRQTAHIGGGIIETIVINKNIVKFKLPESIIIACRPSQPLSNRVKNWFY